MITRCLFCQHDSSEHRIITQGPTCYARYDNYPAAEGHIEVVPFRHVESFFDFSPEEVVEALKLLRDAAALIKADGYTIGINEGRAAGRTVDHCHIHLIPRCYGDVPDPRGGVRHVLPGTDADAWAPRRNT